MSDAFAANLKSGVFFHGTSLTAAEQIAQRGFRVWRNEAVGNEQWLFSSGGNLGIGIYLSCNWHTAFLFGSTLLRVSLSPGTRVLDATVTPDLGVLEYLRREFGHAIVSESPFKALPKNKQLKLNELVALFRYHYVRTWEKQYRDDWCEWPRARRRHLRLLLKFRSMLIRHGFHGYGDPSDENGVVVFADDRLVLAEVIADLPHTRTRKFKSLDEVRRHFDLHGSSRARKLAHDVARVNGI